MSGLAMLSNSLRGPRTKKFGDPWFKAIIESIHPGSLFPLYQSHSINNLGIMTSQNLVHMLARVYFQM